MGKARYSDDFKAKVISEWESGKYPSYAILGKRYDISPSTLGNWCAQKGKSKRALRAKRDKERQIIAEKTFEYTVEKISHFNAEFAETFAKNIKIAKKIMAEAEKEKDVDARKWKVSVDALHTVFLDYRLASGQSTEKTETSKPNEEALSLIQSLKESAKS